ncbi:hypothetical protein DPMN_016428 [Dreissena polymorpha]|uniref:Uncharacterized protein n=1 Tax=Dreissena polymorpha TaxID=45954 RepID=A0A9D4ND47_DREPO|nr:hypothetical protein DPMN_016428 [Dreissena polymorpha]
MKLKINVVSPCESNGSLVAAAALVPPSDTPTHWGAALIREEADFPHHACSVVFTIGRRPVVVERSRLVDRTHHGSPY